MHSMKALHHCLLSCPIMSNPEEHSTEERLHLHVLHILSLLITTVIPTIIKHISQFYFKTPYHTSILSGYGWVQELRSGHPECIRTELGVRKHVFDELLFELYSMGYEDSRGVTLEEQLAIFLYMCVTGITIRHAGQRFQRSNGTISK